MHRHFNTAGPCKPGWHYMLPPERRLPDVRDLIDRMGYFVLHAPRQTGKTTSLMALAEQLTREGRFTAVLVSMEVGAPFSDDPERMEPAILDAWRDTCASRLPPELQPPPWPDAPAGQRIGAALAAWARASTRPLVLFLDEVDALRDEGLLSILRQLRSGYPQRPEGFPWSIALVGLRDVRDYVVASGGSGRLGTSSPFNVKVESITLDNFSRDEIRELYAQHTTDTGQVFEPEAIDLVFALTGGQPWLVNALADQCVRKRVPDRAQPVTAEHIEWAKDILIERRDTHLDSLAERLREDRVRRIIAPLLSGETPGSIPDDDRRYVVDLGLVRRPAGGGLEISNPIYREIVARYLVDYVYDALPVQYQPVWLDPDGGLDLDALLGAFLDFWRQHGETLMKAAPYPEIAPHLVMMAFLDRVANGGGRVHREFASGSGRVDLLLERRDQRLAIELKVWRSGRPDPEKDGLGQLDRYLSATGAQAGWLVIFDCRPGLARVEDRTSAAFARTAAGRQVVLIRA